MWSRAIAIVVGSLGLLAAVLPSSSQAAIVVGLTIGTPVGTYQVGNSVTDPVNLTLTGGSLTSLQLDITYDPTILNLTGVTGGPGLPGGWSISPNPGTGYVTILMGAGASPPLASSGEILATTFSVVGKSASSFTPIYFTPNYPATIPPSYTEYQQVFQTGGLNITSSASFVNGGINLVPNATTWVPTVSGSWSTAGNWNNGLPVNGEAAVFSGSLTSSLTVTLSGSETAGGLTFSNSAKNTTGYRLVPFGSGTGSLTLNNSGSTVPVQVFSGSHSISAPITLAGNLAINESAGSSLAISGNIGQSTTAGLTLSGDGRLILSGSDSYTGGTTVSGGTLGIDSPTALPPGRSLIIGAGGAFHFALGSQTGSPADSLAMGGAAQPAGPPAETVPEPGTLALAVVVLCSAGIYHRFFRRPKRRR